MPPVFAAIPEIIAGLGALVPEAAAAGAGAEAAALPLEVGAGAGLAGLTGTELAGLGTASGAGLGTALETTAALGPLAGAGEAAAGAAPLAFTVNALPGAAAAFGGADLAGALSGAGLGAAATEALGGGFGPGGAGVGTFQPPPGAALSPAQTVAADFSQFGAGQPLSFSAASPLPTGGGGSAAAAAAPDVGGGAPAIGPASEVTNIAQGTGPAQGGGLMDFLSKNQGLAATLGIGGLGTVLGPKIAPLLSGKLPQQAGLDALRGQAQSIAQQQAGYGTQLEQPLLTGQLPGGAEQAVKNAVHDATVATKARYANLGLSGSTMEQDALNNIQDKATAQRFAIAEQMAATGQQATTQALQGLGLQDRVYTELMNAQLKQDQALQDAIARFASAAALGTGLAASKA